MKRFLSWVALALITGILSKLAQIIYQLLFAGIAYTDIIPDDISLFGSVIALVLIVGSGLYVTYLISKLAIRASQAIMPSDRGTRYSVYGTILIVINLVSFIAALGGRSEHPIVFILGALLLISQGAMIAVFGSVATKKKESSKKTCSNPKVTDVNSSTRNMQSKTQMSALDKRIVIESVMDSVNSPGELIDEACDIDMTFELYGKNDGVKRMHRLEHIILSIENMEDFVRYFASYSCICGLMFSLGHLTKAESDEMSRSFTERVQQKTIVFSSKETIE